MQNPVFEKLYLEGLISESSFQKIQREEKFPLFSLFWELRTILYLSVLLFSTGLGVLVYKNIDSIGHQAVLCVIAAVSSACFIWCNKRRKPPFSFARISPESSFYDYILLLGTLTFLSFLGYLQFQYEVFGTRYGLATFIPMVVLFFIAYYFDHIGVLTLAIVNLAVWMGVTVSPKDLLERTDFNNERFIYTYLGLGLILLLAGYLSSRFQVKKHFFFTYHHYGVHVAFIALLSGYFFYDYVPSLLWLAGIVFLSWLIYAHALKHKSFYFLILSILYSYIAVSGFFVRSLSNVQSDSMLYLIFLYFIVSSTSLIVLLIELNRKIKSS